MHIPTGSDIKNARTKRGMTQSELADQAGVSQPLIARIESGGVDPTVDTLYTVVSALNSSTLEVTQEDVELSMPSLLKEARNRTGYTQGELADAAGVSQPLISRIERQDVNPRASTLRELFSHLDSRPEPDDDDSAEQIAADSGLLADIEREFDSLEATTAEPNTPDSATDSDADTHRCAECNADLSSYPDPSYCPHCGSEL